MGAFDDLIPSSGSSSGAFDDLVPKKKKAEQQDIDRTAAGTIKDIGIVGLKAAVGLPQALVGLADIPTGGKVGKFLAENGLDFNLAQKTLDENFSEAQQQRNERVQQADGFADTLIAAAQNPSTVAATIGESIPQMIGGAGIARGILKAAPKVGGVIAGALGEGTIAAGSAAESIRNETADQLLTPKQSALAVASGAGTALLGAAGGKIAEKVFKVGDVDTMLAKGAIGTEKPAGGFARAVTLAGISEGVFEELPQSVQEQMIQNYALDRPLTEGVGNAAAMGLLSGAAMGGAGGAASNIAGRFSKQSPIEDLQPQPESAPASERIEPTMASSAQQEPLRSDDVRFFVGEDGKLRAVPVRDDATTAAQQNEPAPSLQPESTVQSQEGAAQELPEEVQTIDRRLSEMTPENGYGEVFDIEREQLQARRDAVLQGAAAQQAPQADEFDPATIALKAAQIARREAPESADPRVDPIGARESYLQNLARTNPQQAQQIASAWRADPQTFGDAANVPPEKLGSYASVIEKQLALATPAAAAQATPQTPAGQETNLQNRDRSRQASVMQMSQIAANPDYLRLSASRTPDSGAPMVFAVGDDTLNIEQQAVGNQDMAVMSDGQRVPFRYAVVEADRVQPSNFADGRENPEYGSGVSGTIKALNNGRTAGIRAAYQQGTAGNYRQALEQDAAGLGIDPQAFAAMKNPMLVRLYSERDNTANMAAKSQGQGLGMGATELARQDAPFFDDAVLSDYRGADVGAPSNRDFVRGLIGKFQQAGQDVAGMLNDDGSLSLAGKRRIEAGLMQAAYGDSDLVQSLFEDMDTDIKGIGEALKQMSGQWAMLRQAARDGRINADADITDNLIQAVNLVRKARAERMALYDLTRQVDLLTGDTVDDLTVGVLRFLYSGEYMTRANGKDRVIESISQYIDGAMAAGNGDNLFGERMSALDLVSAVINKGSLQNVTGQLDFSAQEGEGQSAGGLPAGDGAAQPSGSDQGRGDAPQGAGPAESSQGKPEDQERQDGQRDQEGGNSTGQDSDGLTATKTSGAQQGNAGGLDAESFVQAPDGSVDFGEITDEISIAMRRQAGKIRLRNGDAASGLAHIEARHGNEIRQLGYSSAVEFVADIAKNFDAIFKREGSALDIVMSAGTRGKLIVQLVPNKTGDFYDVKTATPIRADQYKNKKPLWVRTGPSAPSVETEPLNPWGQNGNKSVSDQPADDNKKAGKAKSSAKLAQEIKMAIGAAPAVAAEPKVEVTANVIFTEDAAAKARARIKKKLSGGTLNSGIDPELLQDGIQLAGYHIEKGARTFAAYAKAMIADLGDIVRPYLKQWYAGVMLDPSATVLVDSMTPLQDVMQADLAAILEEDDVQRTGGLFERDSANQDEKPVDQGTVSNVGREAGTVAGQAGQAAGAVQRGPQGDRGVSDAGATVDRERGDNALDRENQQSLLENSPAGDNRPAGSAVDSSPRVEPAQSGNNSTDQIVAAVTSLEDRLKAQKAAEFIPVRPADKRNIDDTLPFLHEGQRQDVLFAETRFAKPDGYGVLFTNGTGTGKTYLGLGIVKRMDKQGKNNILIVAPNDAVIAEWVKSAPSLGLTISQLSDINDAGSGIVMTTYANFGQNNALSGRKWDAVVMDEAHSLMTNKEAEITNSLTTLRAITLHPDGWAELARMRNPEIEPRIESLSDKINANSRLANNDDTMREMMDSLLRENEVLEKELGELRAKYDKIKEETKAEVMAAQGASRTRAVFLSATPFAYEKNVQWAAGYLFEYPKVERKGYNQPDPYESFMVQHFGYRLRYNKLTEPDPKVNRDLMQRNFNTWMRKQGVLSARMLDVDADYERKFILIDGGIGQKIDDGLKWLRETDNGRYWSIYDQVSEQFNYLDRARLLEAIKAQASIDYIKQHHALGRKAVVFYDFNEGGGLNVFDMSGRIKQLQDSEARNIPSPMVEVPAKGSQSGSTKKEEVSLLTLLTEFRDARPDLQNLNFAGLRSPLTTLKEAFPNAGVYNGLEKKKDKLQAIKDFNNDDKPEANLLIVQSAANAGWSGHDTTGNHRRVLINLGLPTAPTKAIQQEGRIYRVGQVTDANFHYFNTGTTWERIAFATTIARRAATAENLAMGEQARGLRDAFIMAFEDSDGQYLPSDNDGKGGKQKDRQLVQALSDFDRAIALYYGNLKKTAKTKAQEGADYFATPEPIGLKMVEFADIRHGEAVMEPSAGHGAIARWFPDQTKRVLIEPSYELSSRLALASDGDIRNIRFEDLDIVNKFDAIVMNPPFGVGGKTAVEHVAKAYRHLNNGGRIVALIPEGPSAGKRFDDWMNGSTEVKAKPVAKIDKIGEVFAGDTVQTNVSWAKEGKVVKADDQGRLFLKVEGQSGEVVILGEFVSKVTPTGKRIKTVQNAPGAYMAANISLPAGTFDRAGTGVKTRIVVIEKQVEPSKASQIQQRNFDLSDEKDVEAVFGRMRDMTLSSRLVDESAAPTNPVQTSAEVKKSAVADRREQAEIAEKAAVEAGVIAQSDAEAVFDQEGDKLVTNAPMVEVTTAKGKVLKGVLIPNGTLAKEIDKFTWRPAGKGGKFFVRIEHVKRPAPREDSGFQRRAAQTETAEFKRWFGDWELMAAQEKDPGAYASPDTETVPLGQTLLTGVRTFIRRPFNKVNEADVSKVTDAQGKPLVVYHGTDADFQFFDPEFFGEATGVGDLGDGFYFTDRPAVASSFAGQGDGANVMPVYLSMKNPATNKVMLSPDVQDVMDSGFFDDVREYLIQKGYDGIIFDHGEVNGKEYVVFSPEQIKSAIGNNGQFDPTNPDIRFQRNQQNTGMPVAAIAQQVNAIASKWEKAPSIVVVASMQDPKVPAAVRQLDAVQRQGGATGDTPAFYHRGTVYLVADSLRSPADVLSALNHEALGHYGLRALFGKTLDPLLIQLAAARPDLINAKARQYGLDTKKLNGRLDAAEEVLAELAETEPSIGFVRRAIALIRTWLRKNVPGFDSMKMSDDEILTSFIIPARDFVRNGGRTGQPSAMTTLFKPVFNRKQASPTATFGREIAPLAIRAYESLSPAAKAIVDGWNFNWSSKQGDWMSKPEWTEVLNAFQPVRDKLRKIYGETMLAFRGELSEASESPASRRLFSWTPNEKLALKFALNRSRGFPPEITQKMVDDQIDAYRKTGIARLNGYKYVRRKPMGVGITDGPDFYYIYYRNEMLTDGDNIAEALQKEKSDRDEFRAELRKRGKLYSALLPVDSIAFVPVNSNLSEPEFVAEYNPRTQPARDVNFSRQDQTKTPEFKRWFGDSKVVDADGKSLVGYHGTNKDIKQFKPSNGAIWISESPALANQFVAGGRQKMGAKPKSGSAVYPVYVRTIKPLDLGGIKPIDGLSIANVLQIAGLPNDDAALAEIAKLNLNSQYAPASSSAEDLIARRVEQYKLSGFRAADTLNHAGLLQTLRNAGFDGLKMTEMGSTTYAVFEPSQIKSATGNIGTFDPANPDIRFQRKPSALVSNSAFIISSAMPSAVKSIRGMQLLDGMANRLVVGLQSFSSDPVLMGKAADLLRTYLNWRPNSSIRGPAKIIEQFVQDVTDNLLYLHDQIPTSIRERSKRWYDGANVIASSFAKRHNVSLAQASAVLAINSPQTDWFMNVSRAERIMDIWFGKQGFKWTPEMNATAIRILGDKTGKIQDKYLPTYEAIKGRSLGAIKGEIRAAHGAWIRIYDETYNDRSYRLVTPEGSFGEFVKTEKGANAKMAWASYDHIAKSVSVLIDGAKQNISDRLGGEHKVRSFYNNIYAPNDPAGDVTIDTHAVAAGLLRPLAGGDLEVDHNLGGGASSAFTGASGLYGIYAEAYRRAAAARGILPREMQSITWEAVRGLFTAEFKTKQNKASIDAEWAKYKRGLVTKDALRETILSQAGGINEPSWWQSDRSEPSRGWDSSYGGKLVGFQFPGGSGRSSSGRVPARGAGSGSQVSGERETAFQRAQPQQSLTPAQRAQEIVATPAAGTATPLDRLAKFVATKSGLTRATSALYDVSAYLLDRYTPEAIKAGIVSDYGIPEAVIDRRTIMQAGQRVQLRKAGSLLEKLSTLTRQESRVVYEMMNERDPQVIKDLQDQLPPESVAVIKDVQQMIDRLSKDAIDLKQLSPQAYERNKLAYLHRSYQKYELNQTEGEKRSRSRLVSVLGEQYKGRGLVESATMKQIENAAPEWFKRKFVDGKADSSLIGQQFVRLEKRKANGAGIDNLEGIEGAKPTGRLLEVDYWPVGEPIPSKYAEWDRAGEFEVRDVKGVNVVLWRDFTKAERQAMGEIDEARYAIAKTLHQMIHDVEVGRYLEWVAQTYGKPQGSSVVGNVVKASEAMRHVFKEGDWVLVPTTKVEGTDVAKYGKLAGLAVPAPIWNDIRQTVNGQFKPFGDTYAKILALWKTSKTALSPAVHTNNVMSNLVMADWHDVTAGHTLKALRILLAANTGKGKGALAALGKFASMGGINDREAAQAILNRYADSGGELGSWANNEMARDQLDPLLKALEQEAGLGDNSVNAQVGVMSALQHLMMRQFPQAFAAMKGSKPVTIVANEAKSLIDLYAAEDEVFRLAAWLKAKEEGQSDLLAGRAARKSFLDYQINAPWIQALRNSALPFISYTYRALPILAEVAGKKPHKLLKLMAIAGGLNALGFALAGGDDEEEKTRKLLPEEKAGSIWGMVPKLIRMPWNDANGSSVFLDIRRYIPLGDIFDLGAGQAALPVPPALLPGGPLVIAGEVVFNKSSFTGKPLTLETDTAGEKAEKLADHAFKALAPNILGLPGTYATQGVSDAVAGRTDAFGREMSVAQAMASSVGVKVGSYPEDVLRRNMKMKFSAQEAELDKNIADLKRRLKTNRISQEEFDAERERQNEKKRALRAKYQAAVE